MRTAPRSQGMNGIQKNSPIHTTRADQCRMLKVETRKSILNDNIRVLVLEQKMMRWDLDQQMNQADLVQFVFFATKSES